jgi:galactose mutarotase-like enzyme
MSRIWLSYALAKLVDDLEMFVATSARVPGQIRQGSFEIGDKTYQERDTD